MSSPLVSIIIPTYNSAQFLPQTIDSAVGQSYRPIEVILVDDGSTDGTNLLFPEFEKLGVQCYRIENGGASNARNFGLSKAKGEYIQFLDADDILHVEKIEKQLRVMLKEKSDISFCYWSLFKDKIERAQKYILDNQDHRSPKSGKELLVSFGMHNWFVLIHSWLVKRSLIDNTGGWNTEISNNDDGEFFARVLFKASKVICLNENLAYYRKQNNSLSTFDSNEKIESAIKAADLIFELVKNDNSKNIRSYPKRLYYKLFLFLTS